LIEVATAVRRYKSESNISLGTELKRLQLATTEPGLARMLQEARADIMSVTRARQIEVKESLDADLEEVKAEGNIRVALAR
jgi:valyl-tRNA synthetase